MATTADQIIPAQPMARHAADPAAWARYGLILLLILQFSMIFTRAVNWDEFHYYYEVQRFADGELKRAVQTLHVRFFAWLPAMPGLGVDHIVIARIFMFGCEIVTLCSIILIARRFVDRTGAWLAALAYLSAGFVFQHGFAFRVDPMATAGLMAGTAILTRTHLGGRSILAFAACVALAAMVTMKVVLYAPVFAAIAWWRASEAGWSRATLFRLCMCGVATLAVFALLYLWHSSALTPVVGKPSGSSRTVSGALDWVFFIGLPPYWQMVVKAALFAPVFTLLILAAPFAIWRSGRTTAEKIALTGLWFPVLTPFFYTNVAGYFYVFMLAPVAVAAAVALPVVLRRVEPKIVAIALTALAIGPFAMENRTIIGNQRDLQAAADALFPEPVAYFDHNAMLPDFPKVNAFMTPWAMKFYLLSGNSAYRNAMEQRPVPLLVENWPTIGAVMRHGDDSVLNPADAAALRANYLHFWGPFWLAGKQIDGDSRPRTEEFLVPGPYTVEGAAIVIDGRVARPGDIVEIERGDHELRATGAGTGRLIWGKRLTRPRQEWDDRPLYVQF